MDKSFSEVVMDERKNIISISPKRIVTFFSIIIVILVIASSSGQIIKYVKGHNYVYGFIPKFNLDEENNIPTYFSSFMLLVATFLFTIIAVLKKKRKDPYFMHWSILAVVFLLISIDETASIHELCVGWMREMFHLKGLLYYGWIIPAFLLSIILIILYLKFFLHLSSKSKILFSAAAVIYVGGALAFEGIGGWYSNNFGEENLQYNLITTVEEIFEFAGINILIFALMDYIRTNWNKIEFQIQRKH